MDNWTEIAEGRDDESDGLSEVESSVVPVDVWSDLSCLPEDEVVHDRYPHSHTADAQVCGTASHCVHTTQYAAHVQYSGVQRQSTQTTVTHC